MDGDDDALPTQHQQQKPMAGRVVAITIGVLVALVALALIIGSITLVILQTAFSNNGFVDSGRQSYDTTGYAIVSESFETDGIDSWPLDDKPSVRISVESQNGAPVFVGIAPSNQVESAMQGVEHSIIRDVGAGPANGAELELIPGGAPASAPADLADWDAFASGEGTQEFEWVPKDGTWSIVAIRADGLRDVDIDAAVGFHIPHLAAITWGTAIAGLIVTAIAVGLIAWGIRGGGGSAPIGNDPGTMPAAPPGGGPVGGGVYPLTVAVVPDPQVSRWLWLVKWLLLMPHYIVLVALWAAVAVVTIVAFFAILLTGRYPASLFVFTSGVLRWTWRVNAYSYGALATDRYPPFALSDDPTYPARLDVVQPTRLSRGLVLVKSWLLAVPHLLVVAAIGGGLYAGVGSDAADTRAEMGLPGVLALVLGVVLLFTGRLHRDTLDFLVGLQRWIFRVAAYVLLLRDEYPPFRLDQGVDDVHPNTAPQGVTQ